MRVSTAKKVITVTILSIFTAFVAAILIYIHIYDASKPMRFLPQFTSTSMNEVLSELKPVQESDRIEVSVSDTAEVVAEYSSSDMQKFDTDYSSGYLICRLPDMEIQIGEWYYTQIGDVHGLLTGDTNNYCGYGYYFDTETAKEKPTYRYQLDLNILKEESLYKMHIFCKDPEYLYSTLEETIKQVNQSIK